MLSIIVILLFTAAFGQNTEFQCDHRYDFKCPNLQQCIVKEKWCDNVVDCKDGSDEYFCDGRKDCMEDYFKCANFICIPREGLCDGINSCKDGSDESYDECEGAHSVTGFPTKDLHGYGHVQIQRPAQTLFSRSVREAVVAAAEYLLNERRSDYGWGGSIPTSRALVALAFSERVQTLDEHEKNLMKKYLNIQLSLDLIPTLGKTSLGHLALFINALYATCQDPRNFQGMDLVTLLRRKTDVSMNRNFSLPIVMLTLCIAEENIDKHADQLRTMYRNSGNRISTKALTVMAMSCMNSRDYFYSELQDFYHQLQNLNNLKPDVYTKALSMQAANAMGQAVQTSQLLNYQQENGSFADLLATYYAIPALLNTSLVDLKCKHFENYEGIVGKSFSKSGPGSKKVTYSLWMAPDIEANSRSMAITYEGNKTFFDIMKMAASRDSTYSFMFDEKNDSGKKVYSLAGIPNDVETGMSWNLYRANTDMVLRNSKNKLERLNNGVDRIIPVQNEENHFIFWLQRS